MSGYVNKITENLKTGVDFYGISVSQTGVSLSGSLTVTSDSIHIKNISASISISSSLLISGSEYHFAKLDITPSYLVSVNATEIVFAQSSPSSSLAVQTNAIRKAKSTVTVQGNLASSVLGIEIVKIKSNTSFSSTILPSAVSVKDASTAINLSLSSSFKCHEIVKAQSSVSGHSDILFSFKEILLASISIPIIKSQIFVNLIKFQQNGGFDTSSYQTLFVIDNSPITNQGRTLSSDSSQVIVENKNWNNDKSRYYKRSGSAGRKTFNLNWSFLPSSRRDTIDSHHARDFLKKIAGDPDIHTLKVVNNDSDNETPHTETSYNVFIKDYSETLLRRDLINGVYYWNCSMTLEEV